MSQATLEQVDKAQEEASVAKKQLDEAIETYATAQHFHVEALKVHNEEGG